jgi:probable addiction module antidote protein
MPTVSHDDVMAEIFREDPAYAVALLNDVLEDEDAMPGELLIVLRQMAKAIGGVQTVAEKAELNPTQIYRTLSADGNPSLNSFTAILKAMGMRLAVKRIEPRVASAGGGRTTARKRKKPARAQANVVASKSKAAR